MKPARAGMCVAPHVDRDRAPGVEAMHELGGRVDVLRLAAGVAVVRDLVREVPRQHARVGARLHDVQSHAAQALAAQCVRRRAPRARRVHRPDALPDEDARRVQALEQGGIERVLAAGRVRADRLEAVDDRVHVRRRECVAAARRVLLQRGPAQDERPAVEQEPPAGPAQLAQPDRRAPATGGVARDRELERLQRRVAGRPQVRARDAQLRAHRRAAAGRERDRREAQRARPEATLDPERPRRAAVVHARGDVDERRRRRAAGA